MSIETFTLDGEKRGIRLDLAAVDDHRGDDDVGVLNDFALRHLCELANG
jgi:hypothetical protein